ncbi:unnamed protein product [Lactuca saligna]|uniref:Uncharacterized protein n=1 Tax=Lactuca saligna TaxID=75948 RepID=A0AA36A3T8_LACSI|nr:unnamed protein product [Lactuca saligna]
MVVEYGVMGTPMDDIWVIGQNGSRVWCHVAYGVMVTPKDDIWVSGQHGSCLWCHDEATFLEADHEGKTMLEEASKLGHLDSIFVLGMMLMAEGRYRKQEALDMWNNTYRIAKGK